MGGHDNQSFTPEFVQYYDSKEHKWKQWNVLPLSDDEERLTFNRYAHVSWLHEMKLFIIAGYHEHEWLNDIWYLDLS